jgi:hypothetical protein
MNRKDYNSLVMIKGVKGIGPRESCFEIDDDKQDIQNENMKLCEMGIG